MSAEMAAETAKRDLPRLSSPVEITRVPCLHRKTQPIVPNPGKSSLIVVNGEPGNRRLRRLSNRVKPRQTTFPETGASIWISGASSAPSMAFPRQSRSR